MSYYLTTALFCGIPIAAIVFFVVSLCRFLSASKRNKLQPGSVDEQTIKTRKILLIVASVIAGILVAIVLSMVALLYMAVIFM